MSKNPCWKVLVEMKQRVPPLASGPPVGTLRMRRAISWIGSPHSNNPGSAHWPKPAHGLTIAGLLDLRLGKGGKGPNTGRSNHG